jgi:hypothetical protein
MHYVFAKSVGSASTSTTISGLQLGRTIDTRNTGIGTLYLY